MIRYKLQCGKALEQEYLVAYDEQTFGGLSPIVVAILRHNYSKLFNKLCQLILLLITIDIYIAPFRQAYRCSNFCHDGEDPQN